MTITFRRAVRENVPLLIGCIGPSGGGKTMSAMRLAKGLAKGLAGDKPFAVIDTEAGRAKHYAEMFAFDHADLAPPFRPSAYVEAIKAAEVAGYPVVVVDSMSHVWSGDGGVLDWQEEELDRMAGDDWKKREAVKMAAWIKPKMGHKEMVQKLLQLRCHVILCFRAEEKVKMVKDERNKTQIVPQGWQPICDKNLPYELTLSFLLTPEAPGIPKPIKLQEQHRAFIRLDAPLDEQAGVRLAEWAAGGAKVLPTSQNATGVDSEALAGIAEDWRLLIVESDNWESLKATFVKACRWSKTTAAHAAFLPTLTAAKDKAKAALEGKL